MITRLKVPDAAYAIGTTPKAIRQWFTKGQIVLPQVRASKGEVAEFADPDLCFLALLVQFLDYGATVREANALCQIAFEKAEVEPTDADQLAPWKGKHLWLMRHERKHLWSVGLWPAKRSPKEEWTASLVLDVHRLLTDVLARADERRARKVA